jgi:hypothetical protein
VRPIRAQHQRPCRTRQGWPPPLLGVHVVHARVLCAPYKGRALHVSATSRPSPAPLAPARRLAGLEALTTSGRPEPCRLREAHVVPINLLPAVARPVTLKPFLSGLMFADRRPMC